MHKFIPETCTTFVLYMQRFKRRHFLVAVPLESLFQRNTIIVSLKYKQNKLIKNIATSKLNNSPSFLTFKPHRLLTILHIDLYPLSDAEEDNSACKQHHTFTGAPIMNLLTTVMLLSMLCPTTEQLMGIIMGV